MSVERTCQFCGGRYQPGERGLHVCGRDTSGRGLAAAFVTALVALALIVAVSLAIEAF